MQNLGEDNCRMVLVLVNILLVPVLHAGFRGVHNGNSKLKREIVAEIKEQLADTTKPPDRA